MDNIINDIKERIRNNEFATKDELIIYIDNIRKDPNYSQAFTVEAIIELLNLYDSLHKEDENVVVLDPKVIKESQERAVSSVKANSILENNSMTTPSDLQNDDDKEKRYIPLNELDEKQIKNPETLKKIQFFLSSNYDKESKYSVNPETGTFYNQNTDEVTDIRKNEQTSQYEIYKSGNINLEQEKENIKTRRLTKPKDTNSSAAYVSSSFLVLGIIIITVILSVLVMINK